MVSHIVVKCLKCGQPLIAKIEQKTKRCTYCNTHLELRKLRVFARANSSAGATRIVINMKTPHSIQPQKSDKTSKNTQDST